MTILCGIDGSEHSLHAARVARAIAEPLGDELVLVHVAPRYPPRRVSLGHDPEPGQPRTAEADYRVLADVAERAGLDGVRSRRVQALGPVEGLVAAARVENPRLIVVGARGRSALRSAILGSVCAELPSRSPCPVVMAPPAVAIPALRAEGRTPTLVCGVDDSLGAAAATRAAGDLARGLRGRLVLVHARIPHPPLPGPTVGRCVAIDVEWMIEQGRGAALALLGRAVGWSGCPAERVESVLEVGDPAERLHAVAKRQGAELIVVGSRGHGPLEATALGSTSRTLAGATERPIIVVPAGARAGE